MKLADVTNPTTIVEAPGNEENQTLPKTPPQSDDNSGLTTAQVADKLGVSQSRVRQLKMEKRVKGAKGPVKGRKETLIPVKTANKMEREKRERTGRPKGS